MWSTTQLIWFVVEAWFVVEGVREPQGMGDEGGAANAFEVSVVDEHRVDRLVGQDGPALDEVVEEAAVNHGGGLHYYPHTVLLNCHSKDLGLAGERIGYLVLSPNLQGRALIARAAAFCNRVLGFVNAPALMQRVLPRVLADPNGRVDVEVYARRCRRMTEALRELGFTLPEPRAGFFLFPALPHALVDEQGGDVALTERLLEHRTIVVPGTAFGVPGHLRLSMATPDEAVEGAIEAFTAVIAS